MNADTAVKMTPKHVALQYECAVFLVVAWRHSQFCIIRMGQELWIDREWGDVAWREVIVP